MAPDVVPTHGTFVRDRRRPKCAILAPNVGPTSNISILDKFAIKSASLNCFKGNLTRLRNSTMGQLFLDTFVR